MGAFRRSNDLLCTKVSLAALKRVVAGEASLRGDGELAVCMKQAEIFAVELMQSEKMREGKVVKELLSQCKAMTKMEGVDQDASFRFYIEMVLVCVQSENYEVCTDK